MNAQEPKRKYVLEYKRRGEPRPNMKTVIPYIGYRFSRPAEQRAPKNPLSDILAKHFVLDILFSLFIFASV